MFVNLNARIICPPPDSSRNGEECSVQEIRKFSFSSLSCEGGSDVPNSPIELDQLPIALEKPARFVENRLKSSALDGFDFERSRFHILEIV
jgi:hypothetical protein